MPTSNVQTIFYRLASQVDGGSSKLHTAKAEFETAISKQGIPALNALSEAFGTLHRKHWNNRGLALAAKLIQKELRDHHLLDKFRIGSHKQWVDEFNNALSACLVFERVRTQALTQFSPMQRRSFTAAFDAQLMVDAIRDNAVHGIRLDDNQIIELSGAIIKMQARIMSARIERSLYKAEAAAAKIGFEEYLRSKPAAARELQIRAEAIQKGAVNQSLGIDNASWKAQVSKDTHRRNYRLACALFSVMGKRDEVTDVLSQYMTEPAVADLLQQYKSAKRGREKWHRLALSWGGKYYFPRRGEDSASEGLTVIHVKHREKTTSAKPQFLTVVRIKHKEIEL